MKRKYYSFEKDEFESLVRRVDKNGKGKINLYDFLRYFFPAAANKKQNESPSKISKQNKHITSEIISDDYSIKFDDFFPNRMKTLENSHSRQKNAGFSKLETQSETEKRISIINKSKSKFYDHPLEPIAFTTEITIPSKSKPINNFSFKNDYSMEALDNKRYHLQSEDIQATSGGMLKISTLNKQSYKNANLDFLKSASNLENRQKVLELHENYFHGKDLVTQNSFRQFSRRKQYFKRELHSFCPVGNNPLSVEALVTPRSYNRFIRKPLQYTSSDTYYRKYHLDLFQTSCNEYYRGSSLKKFSSTLKPEYLTQAYI